MTGPRIQRLSTHHFTTTKTPQSKIIAFPPIKDCARVLPIEAVHMLRKAAATEPDIPAGFSLKRAIELAQATQRVRAMYPQFFNHT